MSKLKVPRSSLDFAKVILIIAQDLTSIDYSVLGIRMLSSKRMFKENTSANKPIRALALSGGGFRATLFHLGVVNYLFDIEKSWREADKDQENHTSKSAVAAEALTGITYITSVSGGSILAAHLVQNWERYTDFDNPSAFREAANEIIGFVKLDIRGRIIRRVPYHFPIYWLSVLWRRAPFLGDDRMPRWMQRSTVDTLERYYHKYLFGRKTIASISPTKISRPKLYLLATNLGSKNPLCAFTHDGLSLDSKGKGEAKILGDASLPLARAVAASSAFPGLFPALLYTPPNQQEVGLKLADGGIYDNLGVTKCRELISNGHQINEVLVSDASTKVKISFGAEFLEPITVPLKAADILFRRVYLFERDASLANSSTPGCSFTFLKLRHKFSLPDDQDRLHDEHQKCLHGTRTDLDVFSDLEIAALVRQGYCVAKDILNYPLPQNHAEHSGSPTWDPIAGTNDLAALALHDPSSRYFRKASIRLRKSADRKKRILSSHDWVTYLTLLILLGVLALLLTPNVFFWIHNRYKTQEAENRAQEAENKVQKTEDKAKVVLSSGVPNNFNGKYGAPLQSNLDLEQATQDMEKKRTKDQFPNTYLFFVTDKGKSVYRTVAIYDTKEQAHAATELAMLKVNRTANEYLAFDDFCPKPLWVSTGGFYKCNPSALELERYGFTMIIQKDIEAARDAFGRAENLYPDLHNVHEIRGLLEERTEAFRSADDEKREALWKEIVSKILLDKSWGIPSDIRQKLQQLLDAEY